jgi:hypothetical protein
MARPTRQKLLRLQTPVQIDPSSVYTSDLLKQVFAIDVPRATAETAVARRNAPAPRTRFERSRPVSSDTPAPRSAASRR